MTDIERTDPPLRADEATTLISYLDYHRDTFRMKSGGLDAAQLARRTLAPSDMTLGGMVKHLALVESSWFNDVLMGRAEVEPWASVDWEADRDWEWHSAADDTPRGPAGALRRVRGRLRRDHRGGAGRRRTRPGVGRGRPGGVRAQFSLRWILVHMIEEYARHNGHADLIRESIDGATGE